jgi:hypothetical protein
MARCSTSLQASSLEAAGLGPELKASMTETLEFDARDSTKDKVLKFSLDGYFPWDCQNNGLRELTGQVNESPFLPGGTHLEITLHKIDPIYSLVQRGDVTAATYYNSATAAAAWPTNLTFTFKSVSLTYEALRLPADANPKIELGITRFLHDSPTILYDVVPGGKSETINEIHIHPGTRTLAFFFIKCDEFLKNTASNKFFSARYHFPRHATNLKCLINNVPLIWADGLDDIGTNDSHVSQKNVDLHRHYMMEKMYSKPVDFFLPSQPYGFDQILFFNFLNRHFDHVTPLTVKVKYTGTPSEEGWYLMSIQLAQYHYRLSKDRPVDVELIK